jgi:hypothetical protein
MGVLDFLFEGKPPASVTTYGTTTENMPRWLSDYTQGLINRANAVAAEPYQQYGGPRLASPGSDVTSGYDVARGTVEPAQAAFQQLMQSPGALAAAQPYIGQAAQTFPGQAQAYMNPYIENVVNRSTTLANRALTEKFLPALAGTFGSRGQDARSSAYRRAADRGVRDITEGLQEQAASQLASGYNTAAQTFGQDASRLAGLAGTVGNLSGRDLADRATLAAAQQQSGLTSAAALDAIGRAQQGEEQRSLDLAYQNFAEQRDYPRSTIDWMSSVIRGMPYNSQTATTSQGPPTVMSPSPIAQIGSLATGIGGILEAFKNRPRAAHQRPQARAIRQAGQALPAARPAA